MKAKYCCEFFMCQCRFRQIFRVSRDFSDYGIRGSVFEIKKKKEKWKYVVEGHVEII